MGRRARRFFQLSIRAVNVLIIICAVAMITYSLWLLNKWNLGVYDLHTQLNVPKPWFIQACLGVGISLCLSTLFGYMVVSSTNASFLICIYILVIFLLVLLEIASIVTIFFKIDWVEQLSKLIDERHREFKSFVIYNLSLCRLIVIIALVPQIYVIALSIILWRIGSEQRNTHFSYLQVPDFRNSFLVGPSSSIPGISGQIGYRNLLIINNNNSPRQSPFQRFVPCLIDIFRTRFPSRAREIVG